MENAAEALKIAFAVLLFVLALTLSISSFSQATRAVGVITTLKETQYTYVKPINSENDFSRIVGIETVVSTIYRVPEQSLKIYFFESDGKTPIYLYYLADVNGNLKYDNVNAKIPINYIDLKNKYNIDTNSVDDFISVLVGGIYNNHALKEKYTNIELEEKYGERLINQNGLYEKFKNTRFLELLGEYEEIEGTSTTTQRVITFIEQ